MISNARAPTWQADRRDPTHYLTSFTAGNYTVIKYMVYFAIKWSIILKTTQHMKYTLARSHTRTNTSYNSPCKFQPWTISILKQSRKTHIAYQSIQKYTTFFSIQSFNYSLCMFQAISITWTKYSKHWPIYSVFQYSVCFLIICSSVSCLVL